MGVAALAAVAGVVGAGFASGREAAAFFAAHGGWGLVGVALTTLLLGRTAARPPRRLPAALQTVWLLLVWVTLAATLAVGGEVLYRLTGCPVNAGAGLVAVLAVLAPGRGGSRRWQGVTVALLSGAILLVGGTAWRGTGGSEEMAIGREGGWRSPGPLPALLSALPYASYSSALVAGGMAPGLPRGRGGAWGGAALVGVLLLVMTLALHRWRAALAAPLPMLAVAAAGWGAGAAWAYGWVLWVAAANAAVANTRALGERLAGVRGNATGARTAVVLLAWVASSLGFVTLVGAIYPLLGWAWLPALVLPGGPGLSGGPGRERLAPRGKQGL